MQGGYEHCGGEDVDLFSQYAVATSTIEVAGTLVAYGKEPLLGPLPPQCSLPSFFVDRSLFFLDLSIPQIRLMMTLMA